MIQHLSLSEKQELSRHEDVISKGLATFQEVGTALCEIRDKRLYRAKFSTFEAYCRERWQFSKTHGNRLIAAAQVARDLAPIGVKLNEAQCRELAGHTPENQRRAIEDTQANRNAAALRNMLASYEPEELVEKVNKAEDGALKRRDADLANDRLNSIKADLRRALKKIDGSIDFADRLEQAIQAALDVAESCTAV